MVKKALITGIFGQDGSYLCELLTSLGYEVYGIVRNDSSENSKKIKKYLLKNGISPKIYPVDLNDYDYLKNLFLKISPDEIYHVAAYHVSSQGAVCNKDFFEKQLFDYNLKSTSNILSICYDFLKKTKIFLAGSCLMFDNSETNIQNEETLFASNSLYGLAKIAENSLAKYYRNKGLFACTGILYNHESSRRSDNFVTKKIVKNMCALKRGDIEKFTLGNLDAQKDWGYAKDYVVAMHLMLQRDKPQDFIISSGFLHKIEDIIKICAKILEIPNWQKHIEIDGNIIDRKIKGVLFGDNSKAKSALKWETSVAFEEIIKAMISNELSGDLV